MTWKKIKTNRGAFYFADQDNLREPTFNIDKNDFGHFHAWANFGTTTTHLGTADNLRDAKRHCTNYLAGFRKGFKDAEQLWRADAS